MADERFIVVVLDRYCDEVDAYGPLPRRRARSLAARVRGDLDHQGIDGVDITVVALRPSPVAP